MFILANVGVPMIFIQWPLTLGALVPVILVEAVLIRRWVSLSRRDAFVGIAKANVFSTLVGVPLAWLTIQISLVMPGIATSDFGGFASQE